jgi:hypothetical protein
MKFTKIFNNNGAVALLLVIMITALTLLSSVAISLINTSNSVANYHGSEGETVAVAIDSCVSDALWRLNSQNLTIGTFVFNTANTYCQYQISSALSNIKTVTATASTTATLGAWQKSVLFTVNVSSTPVAIVAYNDLNYYDALATQTTVCGNGVCAGAETCANCEIDCGPCFCGDNICNNSETDCTCDGDCTQSCGDGCCTGTETSCTCVADCGVTCGDHCCNGGETCSSCSHDCGACQSCGNGIKEGTEVCDYTGISCGGTGNYRRNPVGCGTSLYCHKNCTGCSKNCL